MTKPVAIPLPDDPSLTTSEKILESSLDSTLEKTLESSLEKSTLKNSLDHTLGDQTLENGKESLPASTIEGSSHTATLTPKSGNLGAFVQLFIALISVSMAAIFIRYGEQDIGENATVLGRFWVFAVTFGTAQAIGSISRAWRDRNTDTPPTEPITKRQWLLLISVGFAATSALVLWAMSLTRTSVANSVLLNNLTPIFTSLGGWLFLRQTFDRRFLLGMFIAVTGAVALGASDLHLGGESLLGDGYALLSAAFLATYFLLVERLRDRFSATTILLWRGAIGMMILIPIIIITENSVFLPDTLIGWIGVIGLGVISEGMGQRLLAVSFKNFSSSFIALFLLLEPPISAIFAWIAFGEAMGAANWISFGVVMLGLYIAQRSDAAKHKEAAH